MRAREPYPTALTYTGVTKPRTAAVPQFPRFLRPLKDHQLNLVSRFPTAKMSEEKSFDPAKESPKVIEEGQPHYDIALGEAADIYGDIQTAQGKKKSLTSNI